MYVFDYANLINDRDKGEMRNIARKIDELTTAQIVVVTVNSLDNKTIEECALQLFRSWGIGNKEKNNGVLILVNKENLLANKSGRIRIEVGYGLEGTLPDGKAGYILDTYALPSFQKKEYSKGIRDTFFAVASEVAKEYKLYLSELKGYKVGGTKKISINLDPNKIVDTIFIIVFFIIMLQDIRNADSNDDDDDFGSSGFSGGGSSFSGGSNGSSGGGFGGGSSGGGGASR